MKEQKPQGCRVSRRTFVRGAAGAVVAEVMAAPHVLAQSKTPIRIGNINSYTGSLAYAGENNLNGMNLYFDSVNWTIAGRKIELIKEDDQFNPQIGLQKAKKLVESDKVDLIVGIQASNVALAVLNYMKQQKAFYVVSGAGTDAITWDRYPYLFRTSISVTSSAGRWRITSTTTSAKRSSRRRPTMRAAATSWPNSKGLTWPRGERC